MGTVGLARCPVLFVMAPGGATRYFPEHLGTAFLRTVLRRAGIDSRQYLPPRNPSLTGFADYLREVRPRLVGFTVYESNLKSSRAMVAAVRAALPDSIVAVGGPNATFTPEETLDLLGADFCLRGAGEGTVVPIVERILGSDSASTRLPDRLEDVPNLVIRTGDTTLNTELTNLSSFPAKYFATLDDIPSPFQDGIVSTPDVGYLTARGCNQNCTYCSFAAVSGRRVAFHGVERVLDDLAALEQLAKRVALRDREIMIFDDTFTLVPERTRRICEGMIERHIRMRLGCGTRGDRVSADLLRLMRRAGFASICFGLESAVPRILRTIGKVCAPLMTGDQNFEREKAFLSCIRDAVRTAQKCGFDVSVSVMGGLPRETPGDFRATLRFVESLGVASYSHNVLRLFPGTPLHHERRDFGLDAFREPRSAKWLTEHPYSVERIHPLRNADLLQDRWLTAEAVADALCGRTGNPEPDGSAVSAVVIHGHRRSKRLAAWMRQNLAIHGLVVAIESSRAALRRWSAFLTQSRVPFGDLCVLVPDASRRMSFHAFGLIGDHHVRLLSCCGPRAVTAPVEVDDDGHCTISIWLASAPHARIGFRPGWECSLVGPGLQIADSCRLGNVPPRCRNPRVLHVDSKGALRACWYGPVLGCVGSDVAWISSRGRLMRPAGDESGASVVCPLARLRGKRNTVSRAWDLDLASQLGWVLRSWPTST